MRMRCGGFLALVGSHGSRRESAHPTRLDLRFGASAEPTYLDPAFVSDGESLRATNQIYEGLVKLVPGTTGDRTGARDSW